MNACVYVHVYYVYTWFSKKLMSAELTLIVMKPINDVYEQFNNFCILFPVYIITARPFSQLCLLCHVCIKALVKYIIAIYPCVHLNEGAGN